MPCKAGFPARIASLTSVRIRVAAIGLGLALCVVPAEAPQAKDQGTWAVKGRLLGKPDKTSEDVSGIACASAQAVAYVV